MKSFHIIENALTKEEAQELVNKYEKLSFIGINDKEYSNYFRYDFVDKEFSKSVFELLLPYFSNGKLGNKWFITKYLKDGFIDFHRDGHVSIDGIRSKYTVLLYLNDDYEGGELFFEEKGGSKVIIKPGVGTIVVMDQDLWHKANPLISGVKYLMRADLAILPSSK